MRHCLMRSGWGKRMSRLLLDTSVIIQLFDGSLSPVSLGLLRRASVAVVSHVILWEIAIKSSIGKLTFPLAGVDARLTSKGFELLPITLEHILKVHQLPLHHRDPFDRMLIAQAQVDNLILMTSDRVFREYGVATIDA
jgi:PIN domain nuclease of toxin-antitoxin system